MKRTIKVDYLARVEGEGALTIELVDGRAESVKLRIFEPPRFFEAFLRGRAASEAPDITARICGICPVAYQMSACHAIEAALGVTLPESLRALRRLLYAGEWIQSHALHVFMLHAPDFLGYEDALAMAKDHAELVKQGLFVKQAGNAILRVLGGREVHPINVKVGGFYRLPRVDELAPLLPTLERARETMEAALGTFAGLPFPDFERDYEFVALRHASDYPFSEGRIVSSAGLDIAVADYDAHFVEEQVPHSTALHARLRARGAYLCGPLSRLNLNFDRLRERARASADAIGFEVPCKNPFKGLLARGIELVQALDEACAIVAAYQAAGPASVEVPRAAGTGHGATEAPRGLLYHRYVIDETGAIEAAQIVPPTSQNQRSMEEDLSELAPKLASLPHAEATWLAEQSIRNYDPCISCSTHFLKLKLVESGNA
ncbi:MAG TPA: Ni/Fe hydrogenase subunit alpha [Polyangiaceae bacterium]